uniref:Uncharacterized protein n=1 Tax=Anguilla anguilla TaxID=7936 RepID=A0A0E9WZ33_ANGAN
MVSGLVDGTFEMSLASLTLTELAQSQVQTFHSRQCCIYLRDEQDQCAADANAAGRGYRISNTGQLKSAFSAACLTMNLLIMLSSLFSLKPGRQ